MAHPKRRHSRARGRKRRTHYKIDAPTLSACKECSKMKPSHQVCPFCGFYAGREVIKIVLKEKKAKGK
jgi:large subunit ribosomal protein L32